MYLEQRRNSYQTAVHKHDYFVVHHLGEFLHSTLRKSIRPGITVADLGCGEQPFRALIEACGGRYIGVDVVQNKAGTVKLVAPITALPLASGSVHLALCTEVLEHVSDTYGAFSEIERVLAPGGIAVVTVPFAYGLHEQPYDFVRLTPYQIRACAQRYNLVVDELLTSGNEFEVLATTLDHVWSDMVHGSPDHLQRVGLLTSRILANSLAIAGGRLLHNQLPKSYYLNVMAVLHKQ